MLKFILPKGYSFPNFDYGTAWTVKIYNEDDTAFDATGYNGYAIFADEKGGMQLEIAITWTTQSSGIGTFTFTKDSGLATSTATGHMVYYMEVQLEKTGEKRSTAPKKITILESSPSSRLP